MANASISLTGITLVSKLDNFSFINTNWWSFFFEKDLQLDGFVTSDWHAFLFERGIYLEALGKANNQLSGIESTSAIAYVSAIGQINAIEDILGIEANTLISELIASGFSNQEISGIELSASNGDVAITINDSEIVNGIEAVGLAGQITATAEAYFEQSGISAETDNAQISSLADSNININGNELNALFDAILVTADSVSVVSGSQITAELGYVTASEVIQINATAEVNGVFANASVGLISATTENPEAWQSSGQIKRYPANHIVNATAKITGIVANSVQSDVFVSGTVQINATITLDNVVSFTQVANINADGILSISDEELILLMAA